MVGLLDGIPVQTDRRSPPARGAGSPVGRRGARHAARGVGPDRYLGGGADGQDGLPGAAGHGSQGPGRGELVVAGGGAGRSRVGQRLLRGRHHCGRRPEDRSGYYCSHQESLPEASDRRADHARVAAVDHSHRDRPLMVVLLWLQLFGWRVKRFVVTSGQTSAASFVERVRQWDYARVPADPTLVLVSFAGVIVTLTVVFWVLLPVTTPTPHPDYPLQQVEKVKKPVKPEELIKKTEATLKKAEAVLAALEKEKSRETTKGKSQ